MIEERALLLARIVDLAVGQGGECALVLSQRELAARFKDDVDRLHACAHMRRDGVGVADSFRVEHAIGQIDRVAERGEIVVRQNVIAEHVVVAARRHFRLHAEVAEPHVIAKRTWPRPKRTWIRWLSPLTVIARLIPPSFFVGRS